MALVNNDPVEWDTTGIEDQKPRVSAPVVTAFGNTITDLEDARERVSASDTATQRGYLDDVLAVAGFLTKTLQNPAGDEGLLLDLPIADLLLLDSGVLSSASSPISISGIGSTWDEWLLMAWLRGDTVATSVNLTARLANDITAANYYSQRIDAAATTVAASEALGSAANLLTGSVPIPAASSPTGAWGLLVLKILGVNSASFGTICEWEVSSPLAESSGNIQWLAGTGWYNQASVVSRIDLLPSSGDFAAGSRYKLYGVQGS